LEVWQIKSVSVWNLDWRLSSSEELEVIAPAFTSILDNLWRHLFRRVQIPEWLKSKRHAKQSSTFLCAYNPR
jgi:hypothetical protein